MGDLIVAPAVRLQQTMARAGWEIQFIDLDLTGAAPSADMRIRRDDGLCLHARVDRLGRASIERFRRVTALWMPSNVKGRQPLTPLTTDTFLGRERCLGARHMLRQVTAYLTDNATHPVALADMRSAWAAVMSGPLTLATPRAPHQGDQP